MTKSMTKCGQLFALAWKDVAGLVKDLEQSARYESSPLAQERYRKAAAALLALAARNEELRRALAFAACTIKSGESWTDTCEREIGNVLHAARRTGDKPT